MEGLRSPMRMVLEGLEGIVLLVLAVVTWPLLRGFINNLGSRPDERERKWPGDELLTRIHTRATRAITIRKPVAMVWPWIVQFGLNRGGFHSYELLERIGGINVRNVEQIVPRFQSLQIDQEIKLHPSAPGIYLSLLKPNQHLCFRTWRDDEDVAERQPEIMGSFSFYLVTDSPKTCRFLVRTCKHQRLARPRRARLIATWLEDPLDLVMEQRMLRTVRRLAERRGV
jgi:hypothetical protein